MLRIATTKSHVDGLILGQLRFGFRNNTIAGTEMISCDMGLTYKVANHLGQIVENDSFEVVGPGFSESSAAERAVENLATQFRDRTKTTLEGRL
jgi:hypothetical protein